MIPGHGAGSEPVGDAAQRRGGTGIHMIAVITTEQQPGYRSQLARAAYPMGSRSAAGRPAQSSEGQQSADAVAP
jgi:hypothetical protein